MKLTEKANENYKKLFANTVFSNNMDEELMEIVLNFSLDEVIRHENLDEKTRQMVILAVTIASQTQKTNICIKL